MLSDLENAAAKRLDVLRVDAFFDGLRTKARISRMTLVFSFFSGVAFPDFSDGSSFAGDGSFGDGSLSLGDGSRHGENFPESMDFGDKPQVSDGFEIVIGGIGS